MNYNIFRTGLVGDFLDKVNQGETSFINLYENQNKFQYDFKETDMLESNVKIVNENLGEVLLETLNKFKDDQQVADLECAKILYENLKLTPAQASNADFWNYLHHFDMYNYIHKRWKNQGNLQTHIKRHWLMNLTSQKHLINLPLSTLWWSIHLTVDESREEKYELSKVYFSNNRFRTVSLGGMSFVRHKEAIISVLEFMKNHRNELTKNRTYTDLGDEISKFINLLGGTKPLSFFDRDWFTQKLKERFKVKSENETKEKSKSILIKESDYNFKQDIEKMVRQFLKGKNNFGAKEARILTNRFKHKSFQEIKYLIYLIEKYFVQNNIEEKRSVEAYNLLKKNLSKSSFTFFDSNNAENSEFNEEKTNQESFESKELKGAIEIKEKQKVLCYFCLNNSENPNYMISDSKKNEFDYCIEINGVNKDGFLLHFYAEGKIKKTKIDSSLLDKTKNQLYSNGKCNNLNLLGVKIITKPVLFGIAYIKKDGSTWFKAMDEQEKEYFRNDNNSLRQEGKKIISTYLEYKQIKFKVLPYSIKENLGTLVQSPSGRGANILNKYHSNKWKILKKYWPDLFNDKQNELKFD